LAEHPEIDLQHAKPLHPFEYLLQLIGQIDPPRSMEVLITLLEMEESAAL